MADLSPREAFAEAAANGAVHPALTAYLADLDDKLSKLVNPEPDPGDDDDDAGDDAGAKHLVADDNASTPSRKATPASVAGKAGSK